MATTHFVDGATKIMADWLNDVNKTNYDVLGNPSSLSEFLDTLGSIRSTLYTHNFTTDANETATDLIPDCPMIVITDSGTVLTAARTLTLPDVRLPPMIAVFNSSGKAVMLKGHGDIGPGISVAADSFAWVINYGLFIGQPMLLASMSAQEFLGGISLLNSGNKITARTGLDVYSKVESDLSKAKINGINSQTGAAYTLILSDAGKFIETTNEAANTLTFPENVFEVGHQISGAQGGAGQTTLVAGSGVTLKSKNGLKLTGQDAVWTAVCVASNVFRIGGDLEA